jgi:hypothetical protein
MADGKLQKSGASSSSSQQPQSTNSFLPLLKLFLFNFVLVEHSVVNTAVPLFDVLLSQYGISVSSSSQKRVEGQTSAAEALSIKPAKKNTESMEIAVH